MSAPVPTPEQVAFAQRIVFVEQVYFCSLYSIVVWDWLSSLTREYHLIWRKKWTPVKCIYLFCRYWPVCVVPYTLWVYTTNHSLSSCLKNYKVVPLLMTFNMASAELVLLIRTYAFLGRKTWMLGGLLATLAGVFIYQYWAVITQMVLLPLGPPTVPGPCFPVAKHGSKHVTGFFIAPLLFDSLVTGLTLWKAFSMRYRFTRSASESTSFVTTFVNEGLGYFVLISVANLLNGAFYLQPQAVLQALNIPLSIMFPNILACRLILTLRSRGSNSDLHLSTSSPPSSNSARSGLNLHSSSAAQQVTFGGTGAKRNTLGGTQTETLAMSHLATNVGDEDSMYVEKIARDEEEAFGAVPVRVSVVGSDEQDRDVAFSHVALSDGQMTPRARRGTNGVQVHVERMNS